MVFVMRTLLTPEAGGGTTFAVVALALVAGLALCLLIGLATGALVAYTGVHPILVTLGTKSLIDGISIYLTRGMALSGVPEFVLGHAERDPLRGAADLSSCCSSPSSSASCSGTRRSASPAR